MVTEKYILVSQFCHHAHIENSFVESLREYGLIKVEKKETEIFIDAKYIDPIEKLFRLHKDLGINFEGLDAINHMLKRMRMMERDLEMLQKKLRLYE